MRAPIHTYWTFVFALTTIRLPVEHSNQNISPYVHVLAMIQSNLNGFCKQTEIIIVHVRHVYVCVWGRQPLTGFFVSFFCHAKRVSVRARMHSEKRKRKREQERERKKS